MKILIDMNLSPTWVPALAKAGVKSVHWMTVGDPAATDRVIMAYAQIHGYIVLTNDLDFGALLAVTNAPLPSVVQVRNQDLMPAAIGDCVIAALDQFQASLATGALLTIDHSRSRVRLLPMT